MDNVNKIKLKDKLKNKFNNEKTKTQLYKLCQTATVCLLLLFVVESLFQIPAINNFFSPENGIGDEMGIVSWCALWLLMFLQVTIIPIPMLPILVVCNKTSLVANDNSLASLISGQTLGFVLFCTSAIVAGSMCAYLLGKLFGRKAVKWAAGDEQEFDKWSNAFNSRKGKFFYMLTVLFPLFPDDIISIVMGAVKMDFLYFVIVHAICSFIGTYTMLIFMRLPYISEFFNSSVDSFPVALVVYSALLVICCIILLITKHNIKKSKQ